MNEKIIVGIADLKIGRDEDILVSYALGSCVGICMYDKVNKVAGLSHILLPKRLRDDNNLMKYADTAVPLLLEKMVENKASRFNITAKIAGGANMFGNISMNSNMQIGQRNIAAVKEELSKLGIKIIAEDVGGNYGRTVEFNADNGILSVRSLSNGNKDL